MSGLDQICGTGLVMCEIYRMRGLGAEELIL